MPDEPGATTTDDDGLPGAQGLSPGWATELSRLLSLRPQLDDAYALRGAASDPDLTNCTEVGVGLAEPHLANLAPGVVVNRKRLWLNVDRYADPFAPVDELLRVGAADRWDPSMHVPGERTNSLLGQCWTGSEGGHGSGHVLPVLQLSPHADPFVLTMEGHSRDGGGVIARGIGRWEQLGNPGHGWWSGREDVLPRLSTLPWQSIRWCRMKVLHAGSWLASGLPFPT